jgi:geranylgeranyl transferase type-1 subunit beta
MGCSWLDSITTLTHLYLVFPFQTAYSDYDTPHVIMTYTALLALAILRDDFSSLDRSGLMTFLRACQREDGRFVA